MIQKDLVYHKSTKGAEAIATRQHGLTPKQRSMLILVDGKRKFDELIKLSQMLGSPEELLEQLADNGFIEPLMPASGKMPAPPQTSSPAPLSAPESAPAAASTLTLVEAQRYAVRRLVDLLGPVADDLCMRIESTRNLQDFMTAVTRAETTVREVRGPKMASDFAADVLAHRPMK